MWQNQHKCHLEIGYDLKIKNAFPQKHIFQKGKNSIYSERPSGI